MNLTNKGTISAWLGILILVLGAGLSGCEKLDNLVGDLAGYDGDEFDDDPQGDFRIPFRNHVTMRTTNSAEWAGLDFIGRDDDGEDEDSVGNLETLYAAHNFYNLFLAGELISEFPEIFSMVIASESADWSIEIDYEYDSEFDFAFINDINGTGPAACFTAPDATGVGALVEFEVDRGARSWIVKIPGFENPLIDCGPNDFRMDDLYVLIRSDECANDQCDRLGIEVALEPDVDNVNTVEIPFTGESIGSVSDIGDIPSEDFLVTEDALEGLSNPGLNIDTLRLSIDADHLYIFFFTQTTLDTSQTYELNFYQGSVPRSSMGIQRDGGIQWSYSTSAGCASDSVSHPDEVSADEVEGDIVILLGRDCLNLQDDTDIDALQVRTTFEGDTVDLLDITGLVLGN